MKSLIAFVFIIKVISSLKNHKIDQEKFFYLKSIAYIIISSIHSIIINIPIPLGAIIMFCLSLVDHKNFRIKLKLILTGIFIILLSTMNFNSIATPLKKAYLYTQIRDVNAINIYSFKNNHQQFLFTIDNPESVQNWVQRILLSKPYTDWNYKTQSTNLGYMLELKKGRESIPIYFSPYLKSNANIFIGESKLTYTNEILTDYLYTTYSSMPSSLTISTSQDITTNIYNSSLLNTLWQTILWSEPVTQNNLTSETFNIPSYLSFDKFSGAPIKFTKQFDYAMVDQKKIIKLPESLQEKLNYQYILSQLDYVNQLGSYQPTHFSNPKDATNKYVIQMDENEFYYGLYLRDYKTNSLSLLHTLHSPDAKYFILQHPYILLLDEKKPKDFYLMLVNQNIPEKHRYISKNEDIFSHSISLCPQNTKFTYIINQGDTSTLYLVSDYYRSPKSIATGQILDSLFLSDQHVAFIQIIDENYFLCIYSLNRKQTIKYIPIPGKITFTKSEDNTITFAVQNIDNLNLKEGLFRLDSQFNIYKVDMSN